MRNFQSMKPFFAPRTVSQQTQGGARAGVQAASDAMRDANPMSLTARIYAPTSIKNFDQDDPRYAGKSDNVENIYLPANESKPRSGLAQIMNWLTTGRME